jgi:transposase
LQADAGLHRQTGPGTLSAMRHNVLIKQFAERFKKTGKPSKVVIVACRRKLLTIMNSMIKNKTPWNPAIT